MSHTTTSGTRAGRARALAALTAILFGLLTPLVAVGSAQAVEGPTLVPTGTRCYGASGGSAAIGVHPPQLRPMPSTVTIYVGDNSQYFRYQPYVQRWNGSAWVTIATGPVFSGFTSDFTTTYYGSTGGYWQPSVAAQRSIRLYYRVAAQVWWLTDSTHSAAYSNRLAVHQQWTGGVWTNVSYCTY
jgi:hypothetical protein